MYCKPFYVFKSYGDITDITENDHRASLGLCMREDIRSYPDDTLIDVWKLVDGDLSTVGINNKNVYRADLRKSVSIRDRFVIKTPHFLHYLFSKVKVGVGSKHIYVPGDFMTAHRDARLPDLCGLPHVMTLVVFNADRYFSGGELRINGVDPLSMLDTADNYSTQCPMVLFPITQLHEVTPILRGERHTFVFPVYGELDIFNRTLCYIKSRSSITTVYSAILADIDKLINNSVDADNSEFRGELLGKLEVLDDEHICRQFIKYRNISGDIVPSERAHGIPDDYEDSDEECGITKVTYTLNNNSVTKEVTDVLKIPDGATDITVYHVEFNSNERLFAIRSRIAAMQTQFLENIKLNHESATKSKIPTLPPDHFIYIATNLYYSDATENSLIGVDAHVYQLAAQAKRKIKLVFVNKLQRYILRDSLVDVYKVTNDTLVQLTDEDGLPDTEYINSLHAEHDDQGGYDCEYERVYCCLVISHESDTI